MTALNIGKGFRNMWNIRPAEPGDLESASADFPDLLVDRWRKDGNRRSLVAVDEAERIIGHVRGIDNVFHPATRTLVWETLPEADDPDLDEALIRAQSALSPLPLRMKIAADDARTRAVFTRLGGVVDQVCPPWCYIVGSEMQAWAEERKGAAEPVSDDNLEELLQLFARHYAAQHEKWDPSAEHAVLLELFSPAFQWGSSEAIEAERSCLIRRNGEIVAAGLLWPEEDELREVSWIAMPYENPDARRDLETCLAHIILGAAQGEVLGIDAHATERLEMEIVSGLPGVDPAAQSTILGLIPRGQNGARHTLESPLNISDLNFGTPSIQLLDLPLP